MRNPKTDCFAFTETRCRVLMSENCLKCRFYKTQKQFDDDLARSNRMAKKKGYCGVNNMERLEKLRAENARRAREAYARKRGKLNEKV